MLTDFVLEQNGLELSFVLCTVRVDSHFSPCVCRNFSNTSAKRVVSTEPGRRCRGFSLGLPKIWVPYKTSEVVLLYVVLSFYLCSGIFQKIKG